MKPCFKKRKDGRKEEREGRREGGREEGMKLSKPEESSSKQHFFSVSSCLGFFENELFPPYVAFAQHFIIATESELIHVSRHKYGFVCLFICVHRFMCHAHVSVSTKQNMVNKVGNTG